MPLEIIKKPKVTNAPSTSEMSQSPSLLRDIFEGLVDTGLGAIGVGPDSKMNRVGGLLGAALPLSKIDKLRFDILKGKSSKMSLNPTEAMDLKRMESGLPFDKSLSVPTETKVPTGRLSGRYETSLSASDFPPQNRLAMGMSPKSDSLYDEAGRYLGPAQKKDPAFEAHVASSRNKLSGKKMKIQSPEQSFVSKGEGGISPTDEMLNQLIKKYSK